MGDPLLQSNQADSSFSEVEVKLHLTTQIKPWTFNVLQHLLFH